MRPSGACGALSMWAPRTAGERLVLFPIRIDEAVMEHGAGVGSRDTAHPTIEYFTQSGAARQLQPVLCTTAARSQKWSEGSGGVAGLPCRLLPVPLQALSPDR